MLLGRNRVVDAAAQDFQLLGADLISARTARLGLDDAGDLNRRLLRQFLEFTEGLFFTFAAEINALGDASSVTQKQKFDFAGGAMVVNPTSERNGLPHMVL